MGSSTDCAPGPPGADRAFAARRFPGVPAGVTPRSLKRAVGPELGAGSAPRTSSQEGLAGVRGLRVQGHRHVRPLLETGDGAVGAGNTVNPQNRTVCFLESRGCCRRNVCGVTAGFLTLSDPPLCIHVPGGHLLRCRQLRRELELRPGLGQGWVVPPWPPVLWPPAWSQQLLEPKAQQGQGREGAGHRALEVCGFLSLSF